MPRVERASSRRLDPISITANDEHGGWCIDACLVSRRPCVLRTGARCLCVRYYPRKHVPRSTCVPRTIAALKQGQHIPPAQPQDLGPAGRPHHTPRTARAARAAAAARLPRAADAAPTRATEQRRQQESPPGPGGGRVNDGVDIKVVRAALEDVVQGAGRRRSAAPRLERLVGAEHVRQQHLVLRTRTRHKRVSATRARKKMPRGASWRGRGRKKMRCTRAAVACRASRSARPAPSVGQRECYPEDITHSKQARQDRSTDH